VTAHSEHGPETTPTAAAADERVTLGERVWPAHNIALIVGIIGIVGGIVAGYFSDPGFRRFYFAYLISYCFFLAIAFGSLAFVLLQFLTRAGWSVNVRRVGEGLAATLPVMAVLSLPILISVGLQHGALYRWAQPASHVAEGEEAHPGSESDTAIAEGKPAERGPTGANAGTMGHPSAGNVVPPLDELTLEKRAMLNPWGFIVRIIIYFVICGGMAMWYWRSSTAQDTMQDQGRIDALTDRMQVLSAPLTLVLGLVITFAAFDLLMSLDPHWFSTIFGFYFISSSLLAAFAAITLVCMLLQHYGYLTRSITTEHYHDLGKFTFAMVFFWGYIAFSQYMLLWYANIPEETAWLARRGATTATGAVNGYSWWSIALLFGGLLIPFAGLLSRHVKRRGWSLAFWAVWVLVFRWVDMYWIAMPELTGKVYFGLVEILCFLGIGGIFVATLLRLLSRHALRPVHDPRVVESMAFQNA